MGMDARVHPLFAPESIDWTPPPGDFDAVLMTSANAARSAGDGLTPFTALPAYAVGDATATAMRAAGFGMIVSGNGDGTAIAARIAADGHRRVLHLAGQTVAPMDDHGLTIRRIAVYRMAGRDPGGALLADITPGAVLMIHSPRAGERLATIIPAGQRGALHLVAISPAALAASGAGWATSTAPSQPRDDDMLALARRLCE